MAFIDDHRSQPNIKLNNFTEEEGELPTQSNAAPTNVVYNPSSVVNNNSDPGLETNVAVEELPLLIPKRNRGRPKKPKKRRGRPPKPLPEKPLEPEADAEPEPEGQPDDVCKKKRGRPLKASKANLGKETCVPPVTHTMLRRSGGDVPTAGDLAKALSDVLLEKQMLREQVETLTEKLRCEKQKFEDLSSEHNQLISLCQEKESALQENCSSQRDQILNLQQALSVANLKLQEEKEARISLEKDRKQQIMELERLMSRYLANREQQQQIMEQQIQDVNFQSNLLI